MTSAIGSNLNRTIIPAHRKAAGKPLCVEKIITKPANKNTLANPYSFIMPNGCEPAQLYLRKGKYIKPKRENRTGLKVHKVI